MEGGGGGVDCPKQGRSPCSRHEVASAEGGSGRGMSPLPIPPAPTGILPADPIVYV